MHSTIFARQVISNNSKLVWYKDVDASLQKDENEAENDHDL